MAINRSRPIRFCPTGLVDAYSTADLLKLISSGRLAVDPLVTHRFKLGEFLDAYDTFSRPAETGALKVVLSA